MKIKDGFIIREIADEYVVVAVGERSRDFHGMVTLNRTGRDIWQGLSDGKSVDEIVDMLSEKHGARNADDRRIIEDDVKNMISEMKDAGFVIDE